MKQDLIPLFSFEKDGEFHSAGAIITVGDEQYKASSFITNVVESIKDDVDDIVKCKEMGELTVAIYVVLESLQHAGLQKIADNILRDPKALLQTAMFCAIGIKAGMIMPEGAQFETTTEDNPSLRDITEDKSEESD